MWFWVVWSWFEICKYNRCVCTCFYQLTDLFVVRNNKMNHNFLYLFTQRVFIRQNKIYRFVQFAKIKTANIYTISYSPNSRNFRSAKTTHYTVIHVKKSYYQYLYSWNWCIRCTWYWFKTPFFGRVRVAHLFSIMLRVFV